MENKKVFTIKFIHSVIFVFMVVCLAYMLYCAITRTYNWALLVAVVAIFVEGMALLLNRWKCPLTSLAEKYGAANGAVTDIFLPPWLTRHTFEIATPLAIIIVIWLAWGYFTR